jgi:hypothetical protein
MSTQKKATIILYGGDRQLWNGPNAQLTVQDLQPTGPVSLKEVRLEQGKSIVELDLALPFDGVQRYGILVSAADHRPASYIMRHETFLRPDGDDIVEQDETILRLLLVPSHPSFNDVPNGYDRLRDVGSVIQNLLTAQQYQELREEPVPARQLALLNLEAKLRSTRLEGESLLSFVTGVDYVEVDRLFIRMKAGLKEKIRKSPEFGGAGGHGVPDIPVQLPAHPDSWKHKVFDTGNIQLSFARNAQDGGGGPSYSVDVDIDLERGIGHVFEWLRNNVFTPGHKTDQTSVYSLLWPQNILPLYTLGSR